MYIKVVSVTVFILLVVGGFLAFDLNPIAMIKQIKMPQIKEKKTSAKAYIDKLEGRKKENIFAKSKRKAKSAYAYAGQKDRYEKTARLSIVLSIIGAAFSLMIGNILLAPVLAIGLYFLPLWFATFAIYRYNKRLISELETSLSMVTSAYIRHSDIIKAIEENIKHINNPVKAVFERFAYNVKFVNPNVSAEIEQMKARVNNIFFDKWCDNLILCQTDRTLSNSLLPIITELSHHKKNLMKNETAQMKPIKEAVTLVLLVVSVIPLLWLLNKDWFHYLTQTAFGQLTIAISAVGVLLTINKAINLSQKTEF